MKKQKTDKGFSLIELIIVIAIMDVLVVVCAPMYIKYIHNAGVARDWANLRLYYDEIQADYASTGEYNPNVKALSTDSNAEAGYIGLKQIDSLNGDTIKMKAGIFVVRKTKSGYHIYYQCNKCSDPHHSSTCDLVLGA